MKDIFEKFIRTAEELFPQSLDGIKKIDRNLIARQSVTLPSLMREKAEAFIALADRILSTTQSPPHAPGVAGVFVSYDFHITAQDLKLIEINTKAAMSSIFYILSQTFREKRFDQFPQQVKKMFEDEMVSVTLPHHTPRAAIIDTDPETQAMWPEFCFFEELFSRWGWSPEILDKRLLTISEERRLTGPNGKHFDLVYNRDTDFYLSDPSSKAVLEAYAQNLACVTPNPSVYSRLADKNQLIALRNQALQLEGSERALIESVVPESVVIDSNTDANALWAKKTKYFFKPLNSYGSKAVYRGKSVSRKVFDHILHSPYLAQEYCPPGVVVSPDDGSEFRFDVRFYTYKGKVQIYGARLYQGQATNLRTLGGGAALLHFV